MGTIEIRPILENRKAMRLLCAFVAAGGMAGCANFLPRPTSATEPRGVYAWPLAACPSDLGGRAAVAPVAAALAVPLLNDLINGLVSVPVAALQSAAAADKNGFNVTTMNPRMFFVDVEGPGTTGVPTWKFSPPQCYVVAYTSYVNGGSGPSGWCKNSNFAKGVAACDSDAGTYRLSMVSPPDGSHPGFGLAVPDAYFEVQMEPEVYHNSAVVIARPKVLAMYYPKSLIEPTSDKPRAITLTLTHAPVVAAADPAKVTAIGIYLPHVVPKVEDTKFAAALANQQSSWTAFPITVTIATTDTKPQSGLSYYPVTISAKLQEIGNPSAFLQAFSAAVANSAPDLTKAVANDISPVARATADQQDQTNQGAYYAALATAEMDLGKMITACTPRPTTDTAKAAARAASNQVKADRAKANAAAVAARIEKPFKALDGGLAGCF
jgi:hypothetical protein